MKKFKDFIKEETMPYAGIQSGNIDIENSEARDQINTLLTSITSQRFVTPYIGLERVAKTLANFHIFIPSSSFFEGDSGIAVWPVNQFGIKMGQTNSGDFVEKGNVSKDMTHGPHMPGEGVPEEHGETSNNEYSIFFEYQMSDNGMFDIFCEIVNEDELTEIMDDLGDDLEYEEEEKEELDEGWVSIRDPLTGKTETYGGRHRPISVPARSNKKPNEPKEDSPAMKDALEKIKNTDWTPRKKTFTKEENLDETSHKTKSKRDEFLSRFTKDIEDKVGSEGEKKKIAREKLSGRKMNPFDIRNLRRSLAEQDQLDELKLNDDQLQEKTDIDDRDETPPFVPDEKKSTPWTSPHSKAKHLARDMMKNFKKRKEEESQETTKKK